MSGLAPRAPADSVRPRGLSAVVVRPLTFTVRRMYPPASTLSLRFDNDRCWQADAMPPSSVGSSNISRCAVARTNHESNLRFCCVFSVTRQRFRARDIIW